MASNPTPDTASGSDGDTPAASLAAQIDTLCQAIKRKLCITAIYNKKTVTLAPHIVYTKHGDHFLCAVTIDQDGKKPRMTKLGTFKLTGLTAVGPTAKLFVPQRTFQADASDYIGNTVCVL